MAVVLDKNEYLKGVEENMFSVLGKLSVQRGADSIMILALKEKLFVVWGLSCFKVIPIGKGFYHVSLHSMSDQSKVMSQGVMHLKPGLFRVLQ